MVKAFLLIAGVLLSGSIVFAAPATGTAAAQAGIDAFNQALIAATKKMDNAASVALWDEDGVSLLPSTKPIVGKTEIAAFLDRVTKEFPGAHMDSFTLDCDTIFTAGSWASERCVEHQVVKFSDDKPPFDGRGTILYVLHRGKDGKYRIRTEMWNPGAASEPAARPAEKPSDEKHEENK